MASARIFGTISVPLIVSHRLGYIDRSVMFVPVTGNCELQSLLIDNYGFEMLCMNVK